MYVVQSFTAVKTDLIHAFIYTVFITYIKLVLSRDTDLVTHAASLNTSKMRFGSWDYQVTVFIMSEAGNYESDV